MKTAVVTGGNTGIGFETAVALTAQGFNTIIACRDKDRGRAAVERIRARVPSGRIEARLLDLADFSSIHAFASTLTKKKTPIDVLVNNAGAIFTYDNDLDTNSALGVMMCPQMKTKNGLELQMGVNHMGHFLLTSLLFPLMKNRKETARIINLSSIAHRFAGGINFEDINNDQTYKRWPVYCQSKLANVLFTNELTRRIPKNANIAVNACHPGVVATDLQRHYTPSNILLTPFVLLVKYLAKTPIQGAQTSIYLATNPDVSNVTGKYFKDSKEVTSHVASYNEADAKKLWDLSTQMTQARWKF